jgi:uncharacterized protein YjbI with pentapeptide repeats
MGDFYGTNFEGSRIGAAHYACFLHANLRGTSFGDEFIQFLRNLTRRVNQEETPLGTEDWVVAMLRSADLTGSNLQRPVSALLNACGGNLSQGADAARSRVEEPHG